MAGVNVTIGADSRKASKELKAFEKKTQSIAVSIAKGFRERIGHKIFDGLASAAREIPEFLNDAINTASSLNEELGKSKAVFGASASEIENWSKTTADAFGIANLQALQATGTMGNMLRAFNVTDEEASKMAMSLVELAADMGSFNEASVEDTIFAIGAALRGENEPIRKFGVALDDARLKEEALSQGLYSGTGALDANAKAMAAYGLIIKQTKIQQGNFAKTSDDLANSKKRLAAKFKELQAEIGEKFLPIMKEFVSMLNDIDMESVSDGIDTMAVGFAELGKSISDAYDYLVEYGDLIKNLIPGFDLLANSIGKLFPDRVEKNVPIIPTPDFLKEQEEKISPFDQETVNILKELDAAEAEFVKNKAQEAELMKEHDEMMKAQIHAERERLELLEKQTKEREKAEQAVRDDTKKGIKDDIAKTLSDFGITSASQGNMLQDLLGIGFSESEAKRLSGLEGKRQELLGSRDQLNALSSRSSISAVSSMQRIGGGGGVAGEIDLQRKQTDLQQKMVGLLEELKTEVSQTPVAQ